MQSALARYKRLEVSERAFELAAHIRAIHGFKTPDALHIATATLNGCNLFWTRDEKILSKMPGFASDPTAEV
jgi:predicted nucleic acid-binding protein